MMGIASWGAGVFQNQKSVIVAQHCEYTEGFPVLYLAMVSGMLHDSYLHFSKNRAHTCLGRLLSN